MTRRFVLGAAGAMAVIASANAADLGGGMKEPPVIPYSWAGWYVGVNGGGAWGTGSEFFTKSNVHSCQYDNDGDFLFGCADVAQFGKGDFTPSGGFGGGQVGFNWQRDRLVYGLEADIQGAGVSASANVITSDFATVHGENQLDWFGTLRARLGLTVWDGSALVYATGGLAYGGSQTKLTETFFGTNFNGTNSESETAVGYTLGAGAEYAFSPAWSVKVEYLYMNLGKAIAISRSDHALNSGFNDTGFFTQCFTASAETRAPDSFNIARIGINYHFIPAYEPLK